MNCIWGAETNIKQKWRFIKLTVCVGHKFRHCWAGWLGPRALPGAAVRRSRELQSSELTAAAKSGSKEAQSLSSEGGPGSFVRGLRFFPPGPLQRRPECHRALADDSPRMREGQMLLPQRNAKKYKKAYVSCKLTITRTSVSLPQVKSTGAGTVPGRRDNKMTALDVNWTASTQKNLCFQGTKGGLHKRQWLEIDIKGKAAKWATQGSRRTTIKGWVM